MPSLAELLDTSAQWGRGVQNKISDLVSPEAWAQALRNPPRVLSQYQQMQPGQQQQTISEAFDNALNFGPAMLGKIVYHGSPHKFDAFDASKIGTGEGAQAYGHGLYFAEAPEVAKGYAQNVRASKPSTNFKSPDGRDVRLINGTDWYVGNQPITHDAATNLWLKAGNNQSNLYKVDLPDEHIAKMLDWDKPLSQQAPEVRGAFANAMRTMKWPQAKIDDVLKTANGQQALNYVMPSGNRSEASEVLRAHGIPGIRYLDQGSRAGGQGTSNYVVFPGNEKLTKILERN